MGENFTLKQVLKPALCLDLDSTIRRSKSRHHFIKGPDDIELIPGIERILWRYKEMDYFIIGFWNQKPIDQGFKEPGEIVQERDATLKLFSAVPLNMVNFSFCGEVGAREPYRHRSFNRMPYYGLLAISELNAYNQCIIIDWDKSLFVGDRPEHEECAKAAGIPFRTAHSFLNEPHIFEIDHGNQS